MSAEITEIVYNVSPNLGGNLMKFKFTGVGTGDWVIFDDPVGCVKATLPTGGDSTTAYATADVATLDWTSTGATGAYDSATANQIPASGYIMCGTEIIEYSGVTKSASDGTFTFDSRGCFGTTAASHTIADKAYVLNTVVFALGTTGLVRGIADVMEE